MPIMSYLVTPLSGKKTELAGELSVLRYCEVFPADREELLVLVTDTPDEDREKDLRKKLQSVENIAVLSMAFGFTDGETPAIME